MVEGYTRWLYHGESATQEIHVNNEVEKGNGNNMLGLIHDIAGTQILDVLMQDIDQPEHIEAHNLDSAAQESEHVDPSSFEHEFKHTQLAMPNKEVMRVVLNTT